MRILSFLEMLNPNFEYPDAITETVVIENTNWMRAKYSGLLHIKIPCGKHVEKGEYIGTITDPYGKFRHKIKAVNTGYVININESPIVYQGDAIFHISAPPKDE
jgi:predicted deacylase